MPLMPTPIATLPELKEHMATLFDHQDIVFSDFKEHQTMFFIEGKTKSIHAFLLEKTEQSLWSPGDGWFFVYRNEAENIFITLSPAPKMVLVTASIISLHLEYLAKFQGEHAVADRIASE
jgi:hypothetical protein